jgi:splicing factor 3B subunit 3
VRILSLDPNDCLQSLGTQALPAAPTSLCLVAMADRENSVTLFLSIGLANGVMIRTVVDDVTGELSDPRTRFLGTRPVTLAAARAQGGPAVVALSSRPWLSYSYQARMHLTPLSYVHTHTHTHTHTHASPCASASRLVSIIMGLCR